MFCFLGFVCLQYLVVPECRHVCGKFLGFRVSPSSSGRGPPESALLSRARSPGDHSRSQGWARSLAEALPHSAACVAGPRRPLRFVQIFCPTPRFCAAQLGCLRTGLFPARPPPWAAALEACLLEQPLDSGCHRLSPARCLCRSAVAPGLDSQPALKVGRSCRVPVAHRRTAHTSVVAWPFRPHALAVHEPWLR